MRFEIDANCKRGLRIIRELPVSPEWLTDEFHRLADRAGLPRIRLHDTRATMNTLLEKAGVSDNFRAAWLGHTVAVNRSAYLRKPGDLTGVSNTISPILGSV
jgi:integrase